MFEAFFITECAFPFLFRKGPSINKLSQIFQAQFYNGVWQHNQKRSFRILPPGFSILSRNSSHMLPLHNYVFYLHVRSKDMHDLPYYKSLLLLDMFFHSFTIIKNYCLLQKDKVKVIQRTSITLNFLWLLKLRQSFCRQTLLLKSKFTFSKLCSLQNFKNSLCNSENFKTFGWI